MLHGDFKGRIVLGVLLAAGTALATETITVRSGNGSVGGMDGAVRFVPGPPNSGIASAFTPADFLAARLGTSAAIVARNSAWTTGLVADAAARWVAPTAAGASEGSSALYAIEFLVGTAQPGLTTLDLDYAVDNVLGFGPNVGVYVNEVPMAGSTGGWYTSNYSLSHDLTGLVQPGSNWLYFNATDQGGPSGLLFSATVSVESGATAGTEDRPDGFALEANWPNPFNPVTTIGFTLPETAAARLDVYNLSGTRVASLVDGLTAAGAHQVSFDASNLASGVYFYTLQAAGVHETRKMILQK